MKHVALLAFGLLSILPACGSGGGDAVAVITGLARTAGCTADGIEAYAAVVEALQDELQKSPVPAVLNVNVVVDGMTVNLSGAINTAAGDLSDGLTVGDAAEVIITSLTVDGVVTGSGNLVFNFEAATRLILVGSMQLADGTCSVNISNLNLLSDPTVDGYPTGIAEFTTESADDTLSGFIEPDGDAVAAITASLNDGLALDFTINLDTFNVTLP